MTTGFNAQKAAQVAAFFCNKEGGAIDVLKLVKLIYLADRESMEQACYPITNDWLVSMPHGPVNSTTYNLMKGEVEDRAWSDLITGAAHYKVGLARPLGEDDDDQLSEFDIHVMELVWDKFGNMDKWQIRDWTHANCPEWEDPKGSSSHIPHSRILKFLGVDGAEEIEREIQTQRRVAGLLDRLRA